MIGVFSTFTAAARGRAGSAVKSAYIKAVGIQVRLWVVGVVVVVGVVGWMDGWIVDEGVRLVKKVD